LTSVSNQAVTTYYVGGLVPGSSYWWKVTYTDSVLGTTASNIVASATPPVAALSGSLLSASTVHLSWTNSADYSGFIAFQGYTLLAVAANGSLSVVNSSTNVSVRTTNVTGLANDTIYRFQVRTDDGCTGASNCANASGPFSTSSNLWSIGTHAALNATASANATRIPQGSNVTFSCSGRGGYLPYTTSW
ncbi:MAG: fibronectin type III domain-containing protein, partial [Thermoplasmata archaeon]|nr:fibronectin type III domain-containing protein [Thermoplasmata archaeon]